MRTTLFFNTKPQQDIAPKVHTADANGAGISITDSEEALIIANIGISGDTLSGSVYAEVEVEDSTDDGSSYSDAANANLEKYVTGTNTGTICKIDAPAEDDAIHVSAYKKTNAAVNKIRTVLNLTGTHTNGIPVSTTIVLMPNVRPTNTPT